MTPDELASAVGTQAAKELSSALARIKHCLAQLTDDQVWWRSSDAMNSVGNLILHLCGNLRQWIVSGLGGVPDRRDRPTEFAEKRPIPRADLLRCLEEAVAEAQKTLAKTSALELMRSRRIQGFDVTGMAAIFDSVPHFRGHTQEIVYRTRCHLGDAYQFAWKPSTPEEGAPTATAKS